MRIKLLIADDAPFIREVIRHVIAKANIEVVGEANNGKEAIEMAAKLNPDVVLMDIVMPIMSGIEATKEITSQFPQIKVVACSTEGQESMVMKALDAGCLSYIVKPFNAQELIKVILAAGAKAKGT